MNKLRTARILMIATILLIAAFQAYWINKLYREEENNFKKSADIIFRESMYRLQAERFRGDTMFFRGIRGDNLFMADVVSNVRKLKGKGDSTKKKFMISIKRDMVTQDNNASTFRKDTMMFISGNDSTAHLPHIN